jgi:hypothetical protein
VSSVNASSLAASAWRTVTVQNVPITDHEV